MSSIIKFHCALIKNLKLSKRNFTQNECDSENKKNWNYTLKKLVFNWSGYNKFGLYTHDVIDYDNPIVREALRRLPMDILDARNFRLISAMQLSFLRIQLPKEKWITFEQDLENRYLDTYMKEIEAEQAEKDEFDYNDNDSPANKVK
ncbi:cytochrome b-c1 complex subunit 7-like [Cataglyphis hispanica]|uniref:cytochrome b-c1 complex subunit 7-like n=1 Tax=Cataglyphis hispanica TaxID=1086592 RepID=UPI00217F7DE8|nr:cytochrome b-c1 complex subunit 7-like [Cataglyphis hispanica]